MQVGSEETQPYVNFHENLFSGNRVVVSCELTDGRTDGRKNFDKANIFFFVTARTPLKAEK